MGVVKILLAGLLLLPLIMNGQEKCSGTIVDQNGAALPFVRVTTSLDQVGVRSDNDGAYKIELTAIQDSVFFRALGYTPVDTIVSRSENCLLNITLQPSSLMPIIVKATRNISVANLTPSLAKLKTVPAPLGQTDILKSLTIYPGISLVKEGLTQISVRGGEDNQNLYLLDGATIYNPGHFFGFLSAYNPNTISGLTLYKDHIPGRYATRLSSVLDVKTKSGSSIRRRTKEVSMMTLGYSDEGTLNRSGDLTYGGGIRMAHTAMLTLVTLPSYLAGNTPVAFAGMYDLNLKVRKTFSGNRILEGSIYSGDDLFGGSIKANDTEETGEGSALLRYGNRAATLRYVTSINRTTSEWLLTNSSYRNNYRIVEQFRGQEDISAFLFKSSARIDNTELTYRASIDGATGLSYGVTVGRNCSSPSILNLTSEGTSVNNNGTEFSSVSTAAFLDATANITKSLRLKAGLRANAAFSSSLYDRGVFPALSPSLSLSQHSPRNTYGFSIRSTAQFVHSIDLASGGLPVRMWIPSSDQFLPERDYTFSTFFHHRSSDELKKISLGAYYREMTNQIVAPLSDFSSGLADDLINNIIGNGNSRAYGFEFFAEFPVQTNTLVTLAYTWSRSLRKFEKFNDDIEFPAVFDRPHDLYVTLEHALTPTWTVSSVFALASGLPTTQPTAITIDRQGSSRGVTTSFNNVRLPTYHRLDILFRKRGLTKKNRAKVWSIGLYNVYGRRNPINANYGLLSTTSVNTDTGLRSSVSNLTARGVSLFTFIPIISYEVKY